MRMSPRLIAVSGLLLMSLVPSASARREPPPPLEMPTVRNLVEYLNDNAHRIEGLSCQVAIDVSYDGMRVGLSGEMNCQRPKQVRLQMKCLGAPAVDMGSNEDEYWFWNSRCESPAPLLGRRSEERRRGPENFRLPLRPEWLLNVLGLAEYDAQKSYDLKCTDQHFLLSEAIQSPQGKLLSKTIVFHRRNQTESQIAEVRFQAEHKLFCRAEIKRIYTDQKSNARIAQDVVFTYPAEKLQVRLQLEDIKFGTLSPERAAVVFSSKSTPFAKQSVANKEAKKPAEAAIAIDLTADETRIRYGEQVLKLSGQPNGSLALCVLQDQLRVWSGEDKQISLRITCPSSLEHAAIKPILDACREAGIRKIELRTARQKEDNREDK